MQRLTIGKRTEERWQENSALNRTSIPSPLLSNHHERGDRKTVRLSESKVGESTVGQGLPDGTPPVCPGAHCSCIAEGWGQAHEAPPLLKGQGTAIGA